MLIPGACLSSLVIAQRKKFCIFFLKIRISVKLVPEGPINNIPADLATSEWWLVYQHTCVTRSQRVREQGPFLLNLMTVSYVIHCKSYTIAWNRPITRNTESALWILMTWCFGTRSSVATVLIMQPCISSCLWVDPLWPSDAIWRQISGSTLVQVMACCLY